MDWCHYEDTGDCFQQGMTTYFRSFSGKCTPQNNFSYFTLHQLTFNGFNSLFHSSDGRHKGCQYGGLFIAQHHSPGTLNRRGVKNENIDICSEVRSEVTMPVDSRRYPHLILIFITFKGYSRGYVDITIPTEEICIGLNTIYHYNQVSSIWWDRVGNPSNVIPRFKGCTDVWIMHNSRRYWSKKVESINPVIFDGRHYDTEVTSSKLIISSSLFSRSAFYLYSFDSTSFITDISVGNHTNATRSKIVWNENMLGKTSHKHSFSTLIFFK